MNQSDEQLYELSAKELAESPRQGLLIKCMAKKEGDENKAKALYLETRVEEMKEEIRKGLIQEQMIEEKKRIAEMKRIEDLEPWLKEKMKKLGVFPKKTDKDS